MPEFVVTQTAKEYADYQKKKESDENRRGWYGVAIALLGGPVVCWFCWQLHLWGWL